MTLRETLIVILSISRKKSFSGVVNPPHNPTGSDRSDSLNTSRVSRKTRMGNSNTDRRRLYVLTIMRRTICVLLLLSFADVTDQLMDIPCMPVSCAVSFSFSIRCRATYPSPIKFHHAHCQLASTSVVEGRIYGRRLPAGDLTRVQSGTILHRCGDINIQYLCP